MLTIKGHDVLRGRAPIKLAAVVAVMTLLAISASTSGNAQGLLTPQTVGFHSAILKRTTSYLYMGRKTLSLHIHNGTNRAITQAMIELIAYWPPDPAAGQAKGQVDFDNKYLLVCGRPSGIAPYSDGVLTVDWDSDVKAGTKDDPIVPTKVLQQDDPVYLYGDELDDPPHVQAWLQNEMVVWKGVSVTLLSAPPAWANRSVAALLTPIPDGQRPERLTFAISGFDVRKLLDYYIRSTDEDCGSIAFYDPAHRYYLFMERDGLGNEAACSLQLIPKSAWNAFLNADTEAPTPPSKVIRKVLTFTTDSGIKLGDPLLAVFKRLGRASDLGPGDELGYYYPGGHLNGWSYDSEYDFDHGRLTSFGITIQKGSDVAG